MIQCKVRSVINMRKLMSMSNQWNVLEYRMLVQAWIGYKLVLMEKAMYMDNITNY